MNWTLPGTVLTAPREEADRISVLFQSMFLAGGMVLGQVSNITGLEPYMIQNWVKRGFLAPPKAKRYTMRQLCRILNINMMRSILPMDRICGLLGYINGKLDDEGDDLIDDSQLYFMFVSLAVRARDLDEHNRWDEAISETLAGFEEPAPGAKERIAKVLRIMLVAWVAAQLRQEAEALLENL